MAAVPYTAHDVAIVARTILGEAANESAAGKAAIAAVIANRAVALGQTPAQVAQAKSKGTYQFTAWSPQYGNDNVNITNGPAYDIAYAIAEGVLSGSIPDPTFGATNYFNPSLVMPSWAYDLSNTMTIGNHFFGRDESVYGPADPYAALADAWASLSNPITAGDPAIAAAAQAALSIYAGFYGNPADAATAVATPSPSTQAAIIGGQSSPSPSQIASIIGGNSTSATPSPSQIASIIGGMPSAPSAYSMGTPAVTSYSRGDFGSPTTAAVSNPGTQAAPSPSTQSAIIGGNQTPTLSQIASIIGGQDTGLAPSAVAGTPVAVDPSFAVGPGQTHQMAAKAVMNSQPGQNLVNFLGLTPQSSFATTAPNKGWMPAQTAVANTLGDLGLGISKALSPGINSALSMFGVGPMAYSPSTAGGLSPSMYGGPGTSGASNPSPSSYSFSYGGGPASGPSTGQGGPTVSSSGSSMYGGPVSSSGSAQYGGAPSSTSSSGKTTTQSSGSSLYGGTGTSPSVSLGPVSFTTSSKTVSVPNPAYTGEPGVTTASKATSDAIAAALGDVSKVSLADISMFGLPMALDGVTISDPTSTKAVTSTKSNTKSVPKTITKTIVTKTPVASKGISAGLSSPSAIATVGGKAVTGYTPVSGTPYSAQVGGGIGYGTSANGTAMGSVYGMAPGGTSTTYGTSNGGSISMYSSPYSPGYQGGQPSVVTGTTGGAGVGVGGTVLCTYFYRKGWLSKKVWFADLRYGMSCPPAMLAGYYLWAIPAVESMKRGNPALEMILWPIVRSWATETAYRAGVVPKGSVFGKIARFVLEPLCHVAGLIAGNAIRIRVPT